MSTSPCLWYLSIIETTGRGRSLPHEDVNRVLEYCRCDDIRALDDASNKYIARIPIEWESQIRRLGDGACFGVALDGRHFRVAIIVP